MICRAQHCTNEAMPKSDRPRVKRECRRPYCAARTKKGTEHCQNYAAAGSEFCGIHRALAAGEAA